LTHALDHQLGWAGDGQSSLNRALGFAETARQLGPDLPEAHWVLAFVRTQQRRHEEALRHLDDALQLNPSYADAYALKGGILTYVGRPGDAVRMLHTALRLNPEAGSLYFLLLGRAYYFLGDGEQALVNLQQALQRNAENLEVHVYLAATHWLVGERDAARWQLEEVRHLEPGFEVDAWLASYPMTHSAQRRQLAQAATAIGRP
jgi:tetratricopeptide (TPR) repeat protein